MILAGRRRWKDEQIIGKPSRIHLGLQQADGLRHCEGSQRIRPSMADPRAEDGYAAANDYKRVAHNGQLGSGGEEMAALIRPKDR